jgi:hypothetical protein
LSLVRPILFIQPITTLEKEKKNHQHVSPSDPSRTHHVPPQPWRSLPGTACGTSERSIFQPPTNLGVFRLQAPANFGEVQSRVNYNLSHFSSNYAVVFVMLSLYALLTNWLLMFDIILVVFGMWFIGKLDGRDLEIGSFKATSSQLYTGLLVVSIPLGLIASPFSTLLWLIGASGTAIIVSQAGF